jgi:hypothetical protein
VNFNIPIGLTYKYDFGVSSYPQKWAYNSSCIESSGSIQVSAGQTSVCTIGFYIKPESSNSTSTSPVPVQSVTPGDVISEDSTVGSLKFIKNVLDLTASNYDIILDAKFLRIYGKQFIVVLTSNNHILVYDASDPFSPTLLKDNYFSGIGLDINGHYAIKNLVLIDDFDYIFGYSSGVFKIEQNGNITLINSANLVTGLFKGLDGKFYGFGTDSAVDFGPLAIYDLSNLNNIVEVGSYKEGVSDGECTFYGAVTLGHTSQWNTVKSGNKLYLIAMGYECVQRLHADNNGRIYVFDVSDPRNPRLLKLYDASSNFGHLPSDSTKAERMFLFGGEMDIFVDSNSGKVFDFYRTMFDWQGPFYFSIANIQPGTQFRYRNGMAILSLGSDGSLSQVSNILLCERIGGPSRSYDNGCDAVGAKDIRGGYSYPATNSQENSGRVFLISGQDGSGHVGFLMSNNNFVVVSDPNKELTKFKSLLSNPSRQSRYNRGDAINGFIVQVDSKTFSIYQIDPSSLSVVKLSLYQPVEQTITDNKSASSTPTTTTIQNLQQTIFSFQNLLNIFKRIYAK